MLTYPLSKEAKARWQLEYPLSKEAKARWQLEYPTLTPDQVRAQRAQFFNVAAPSEPTAEELRSYALRAKQHANFKRLGVVAPTKDELPMIGARAFRDHAQVPNTTGRQLRDIISPKPALFEGKWYRRFLPEKLRDMKAPSLGLNGDPHPMDAAINRSAMDHELAELAAHRASKETGLGQIAAKPLASHYSEAPLVAERVSLFNQPRAREVMDRLRSIDTDDAHVVKLMKQMGATPGAPMPFGGRAHRSLAKALESYTPQSPQAANFRIRDAIKPIDDLQRAAIAKASPQAFSIMPDAPSTRYQTEAARRAAQLGSKLNTGLDNLLPDAGKLRELYNKAKPTIDRALAPGLRSPGNAAAYLKHFSRL